VERNFSPWAYWRRRQDETPRTGRPTDADPSTWLAGVRSALDSMVGMWPEPVDLRTESGPVVDEPYGRRTRVVFDTERHMSVPAWLLEPADRAAGAPAVLAVHGHGLDKDSVCGVTESPDGIVPYARRLAEAGFVVLAPDLRGFGERADRMLPVEPAEELAEQILRHQGDCGWELVCALVAGTTPLTLNLWDLRRSVDVLCSTTAGAGRSVAVVGWSYGALLAMLLTALDDRVAGAVLSGCFSSWRAAHRSPWNLCGRQVWSGLLGPVEHEDVAALIAPRPLLVESGLDDLLFPADDAVAAVDALRRTYALLGADPEDVEHHVFVGGHEWCGDGVVEFLTERITG